MQFSYTFFKMEIIYEQKKQIVSWELSYGSQLRLRCAWCQLSGFQTSQTACMGGHSFAHKASSLRTFASEKAGKGQSWLCSFCISWSFLSHFHPWTSLNSLRTPLSIKFLKWSSVRNVSPSPLRDNYFPRDVEDENVFCQDDTNLNC